ncbi:MAG: major capsid protein [Microvirus sp.]|nr:MAG: major capsid protein [Microvirus sp.]
MSKIFENVQFNKPKKSLFDLSHEKKLTMNMGDLVPILLMETIPGDKFRVNTESLVRFAPLISPMMHRVNSYIHFFYVPMRLVFKDYETFITGGDDGMQTAACPIINITAGMASQVDKGSLADYLGLPSPPAGVIANQRTINAMPFRAYQLIYNEYYRDQNLITKVPITTSSGLISNSGEIDATLLLRKRCWEKDYFTSCLPKSQKGNEVLLPNTVRYIDQPLSNITAVGDAALTVMAGSNNIQADDGATPYPVQIHNIEGLDITINDLRTSARLQEFLERLARGGSRLTEVIKSFFGVESEDARLQRPEFLGGGKTPVQVSEVLSTFDSTETAGATMYGHGISAGNSNRFIKFFPEMGYVIGIMSVMPVTSYTNGMPKMFLKYDKYDYYWPTFAQLGEQEVINQEVYDSYKDSDNPTQTFGYQSRYAEYKYQPSTIHGEFKDTLDYWTMSRVFAAMPALNEQFVKADPTQRVFSVVDPAVHKLYVQLYNNVRALRPMPYFNNPIL